MLINTSLKSMCYSPSIN